MAEPQLLARMYHAVMSGIVRDGRASGRPAAPSPLCRRPPICPGQVAATRSAKIGAILTGGHGQQRRGKPDWARP